MEWIAGRLLEETNVVVIALLCKLSALLVSSSLEIPMIIVRPHNACENWKTNREPKNCGKQQNCKKRKTTDSTEAATGAGIWTGAALGLDWDWDWGWDWGWDCDWDWKGRAGAGLGLGLGRARGLGRGLGLRLRLGLGR